MQYLTTEQLKKALSKVDELNVKVDNHIAATDQKLTQYFTDLAKRIVTVQQENKKLREEIVALKVKDEERRRKAIERMKSE